jgi:AcrR family transcriptional regulator
VAILKGNEQGAEPGAEGASRRHSPKQNRSVETRNSIIESAAALFDERGYEQTTTHQIATRARVSVGALYRYFSDKKEILKEVYVLEMSGLRNRILEEFNIVELVGVEVRDLVRKALALVFKVNTERPGLRRVLVEQARKIPELAELKRSQEVEVHRTVRQILATFPGVRVPDADVAAYLIQIFVDALAEDFILHRAKREHLDEPKVLEGAVDLILRYVLTSFV